MRNSRQFFELCAACEGWSLLFLLSVAVPLKHASGHPEMVSMLGPLHGLTFLAYQYSLFRLDGVEGRRLLRGVLASFVPGGTWLFARSLRDVSLG